MFSRKVRETLLWVLVGDIQWSVHIHICLEQTFNLCTRNGKSQKSVLESVGGQTAKAPVCKTIQEG